ncbi:hypothetical protein [Rhodococcus erythropolis]|uniref:hypothetical protein n=1 Tax=Rhodococcus erythropolis TaxID=1833 RepID=UPI0024B84591|nr:hypothetical protein [Rhodococcus erythropolis]MDJ0015032.1 hypothetical protein [Rhodococcus erythropolis]
MRPRRKPRAPLRRGTTDVGDLDEHRHTGPYAHGFTDNSIDRRRQPVFVDRQIGVEFGQHA